MEETHEVKFKLCTRSVPNPTSLLKITGNSLAPETASATPISQPISVAPIFPQDEIDELLNCDSADHWNFKLTYSRLHIGVFIIAIADVKPCRAIGLQFLGIELDRTGIRMNQLEVNPPVDIVGRDNFRRLALAAVK